MLEEEKDWTVLPPELIQIIAKKLPDLLDFIRFRATCKTWRSSAPLSDPPPQLPWFLELSMEGCYAYGTLSEKQRFYSVSSCQNLTISLNQSQRLCNWIEGGAFSHYLPFASHRQETLYFFFNPLTKDQFSLPGPCLANHDPWMVWTGTYPIRNRTIVLVDLNGWACYDPHNNKWVEQDGYFYMGFSFCYWQGMLFSTYSARITEVFDTSSKKLLHKIPPPKDEGSKKYWFDKGYSGRLLRKSYLVESLGIILRIFWCSGRDKKIVENSIFHIYRLEFDGLDGQPCWVRVDNIGNQILFLGKINGFSMSARPSTEFREGCIYFINLNDDKPYVYDILAGTVERVPCPFNRCTWFLPSLS